MTAPGFVTEAMESLDEWLSVFPIEHLDEDWAVPCEVHWAHTQLAQAPPVEWIVWSICLCPPGYWLFCTPCRDVMLADRTTVECVGCLMVWSPPSTAVSLIEPLNRRTT